MSVIYDSRSIDQVEKGLVCHQCNCKSKSIAGVAEVIFRKWPSANTYSSKHSRVPGTNDIIRVDKELYVINMYGQNKPGKLTSSETREIREQWFADCLNSIIDSKMKSKLVYMPYRIGCGLAGGDWKVYLYMIEQFAKHTGKTVVICTNGQEVKV